MATRREQIELRIRQLEAELATISLYGDDEFPQGSVIRWRKQFRPGGEKYRYAAMKVQQLWYVTGGKTPPRTWDQLVELLSNSAVSKIQIATGWKSLNPERPRTGGVTITLADIMAPDGLANLMAGQGLRAEDLEAAATLAAMEALNDA